jgi:hypothetical protein
MTRQPAPTSYSCSRTTYNPLAASRAAKTAASTLEDVARVKKEKVNVATLRHRILQNSADFYK